MTKISFPEGLGLYYGGGWHEPKGGGWADVISPSTGETLTRIRVGTAEDVPAAVAAARAGFAVWRDVAPLERGRILKECARIIRANGEELALLDAHSGGNPLSYVRHDADVTAAMLEYFAGLVTEMKGSSIPVGPNGVTYSLREPYGVVARIAPFNHPLAFTVAKAAASLAAGNAVIVKSPEQAPLSALRAAELFHGVLPAGVYNVLSGGRELGAALTSDPGVDLVALIGSVPTGRAVMRAASDTLKRLVFELGGKNALIGMPDCNVDDLAQAVIDGMNFTWCGQSCGSTSRAFIHADIYDAVVERLPELASRYKPGPVDDPATTMGCLAGRAHYDRVMGHIEAGKQDGGRLVYGGKSPDDPALRDGCFVLPTIFADVTMDMRIAREEIFGPVLSVIRWTDEAEMLRQVNQVEYGLTCAIWTRDVTKAHRLVSKVEAGFCWINDVSRHVMGAPFGGYKQSGIGREECLEELLSVTQEKNVYINLSK